MSYKPQTTMNRYSTSTNAQSPGAARTGTTAERSMYNPVMDNQKNVNNWVDNLKKEVNANKQKAPNLPKQVNLDKYRTQMTSIQDIEKKYGFDFSRDYAEQQANIGVQSERDKIQAERDRLQYESESAMTDIEHSYFNKFREQEQDMANTGINAGIASEKNLHLDMQRQHEVADILSQEQLAQMDLDRREGTLTAEEYRKAEEIYNERLAKAFGMSLDYSKFEQSENQWRGQMEMKKRNQAAEEAWREFEFNNMSYSDRMKLVTDAEKFGMDMAWERYKFDSGMAFQATGASGNVPKGKATNNVKQSAASNTAYNQATSMGLTLTSAYRSPAHNKRVGGSPTSKHVQGRAYDFAGSKSAMDNFAKWAKQSGMFGQVLWQVAGHYDHVHVSW